MGQEEEEEEEGQEAPGPPGEGVEALPGEEVARPLAPDHRALVRVELGDSRSHRAT